MAISFASTYQCFGSGERDGARNEGANLWAVQLWRLKKMKTKYKHCSRKATLT